MGLIAHGASGRTWISRDETQNGGLGSSLNMPQRLIFPPRARRFPDSVLLHFGQRVDFTRRLDQADWSVGVSVAGAVYLSSFSQIESNL